jgi:hypothetical protein
MWPKFKELSSISWKKFSKPEAQLLFPWDGRNNNSHLKSNYLNSTGPLLINWKKWRLKFFFYETLMILAFQLINSFS